MNPMRKARVMFKEMFAGTIEETESGDRFT